MQSHLQHYTEPSSEPLPTTTHSSTLLPLGPGTFTHNVGGVPVIVTCTKADLIDDNSDIVGAGAAGMGGMVKGKGGEWEERTDSIMQVLRTVCLKCMWFALPLLPRADKWSADGAGLFYTTQQPATLQVLRRYVLHLLFMPPPSPSMSTNSEAAAPLRNPFPFQHRTNTLDRDRIVVPAGWDSWGKITVLREGFDAKSWGEAWDRDVDMDAADTVGTQGAMALYGTLVSDQGTKVCSRIFLAPRTTLNEMLSSLFSLLRYHPSTTLPPNKSSSPNTMTRKRSGPTLRTTLAGPSTTLWKTLLLVSWAP